MPNDFFSPEGDLEEHFITDYWLIDQYVADTLWAWGDNYNLNIGDNTRAVRSTPRQISAAANGITGWKQVSCGYICATLAVKDDGTLWGWGRNNFGQVGDNTRANRSTPRQISSGANRITGWKQVSAGGYCSMAVRNDGTLWVWGDNSSARLGTNSTISRSIPTQISISQLGGLNGWKYVSGGEAGLFAIREDGSLWGWGEGPIGDNTTAIRSTPRQISAGANGITGWKKVSTGSNITAAIRNDGTLWAWGSNQFGSVGDGTTTQRLVPTQVSIASAGGLYGWKEVSCAFNNIAAIRDDGTLWCWGAGQGGQIGDNARLARSTPRQEASSSTNWKYVSAATVTNAVPLGQTNVGRTLAIKTDGTLWGWGANNYGAIGDNTITDRLTPKQEATSSTNWKQVSAGGYGTLAVKTGAELN